jgi:AraC-like DNA-binding protein
MLTNFPQVHAREGKTVQRLVESVSSFQVQKLSLPTDRTPSFICNRAQSSSFEIRYVSSNIAMSSSCESKEVTDIYFPMVGNLHAKIEGQEIHVSSKTACCIHPAGTKSDVEHADNLQFLAIQIHPQDFLNRLEVFAGHTLSDPFAFSKLNYTFNDSLRFLRQGVLNAVMELDTLAPAFHHSFLEGIRANMVWRLLAHCPHNYTHLWEREAPLPCTKRGHFIEAYIDAHYHRDMDLGHMAEIADMSGRTLIRYFQKAHGTTPHEYVRKVRLEKARQLLLSSSSDCAVLEIATTCGFKNLGYFAKLYRMAYGELPSFTLRKKGTRHAFDLSAKTIVTGLMNNTLWGAFLEMAVLG